MSSSLQQSLEKADEYAEYLLQMAKYRPAKLLEPGTVVTKGKSLASKLLQIYLEESAKVSEPRRLNRATHLLDKLVKKEKLNTLVVNLYPGNDGFSLMLRGRGGADTETMRLPYEESELLDYIDNEELPPVLLDLLEKSPCNLFYSGCVIVELRDYRRAIDGRYDSRHVLLKPSAQSLWCDIKAMTNDGHRWTQDDIFTLESQLILATAEPLCLDPSPAVFLLENKFQYEKKKFSTKILKRSANRHTQLAVNRRNKMRESRAPGYLKLHDFVKNRKNSVMTKAVPNLRLGDPCVDLWRSRPVALSPPKELDVEKFATVRERPKYTSDTSPVTVEEYILEAERDQGKICYTRLTIQQRLSDDSFVGELYVDRDHKDGKFNGSSCRFTLGNKYHAKKYIEQFTEIFTEEGRRAVKITHLVPDHPPQVSFTHGASAQQAAHLEQNSQSQSSLQSRKPFELSLAIGGPQGQLPINITPTGPVIPSSGPVFSTMGVLKSRPSVQKLTPSPQALPQAPPSYSGQSLIPKTPDRGRRPQEHVQGQLVQSLPAGINLHNIANLQNLQNVGVVQQLQVSVTGVPVSGGQIAVPINMINTTQSIIQPSNTSLLSTPAGIIINSVSGASTSSSSQQPILVNAASLQQKPNLVPVSVAQGAQMQGLTAQQLMQLTPQQQEEQRQRQFLALQRQPSQQQQQQMAAVRALPKIKRKKST